MPKVDRCGKFVSCNYKDNRHSTLMLSVYLLLHFRNLGCPISKLPSKLVSQMIGALQSKVLPEYCGAQLN